MSSSVIVLAGAGHANIQCLKMMVMRPLNGVQVILISDSDSAPYSGMLPGYMMGKYSLDEIHFNLWKLTAQAGAMFIKDKIEKIDPVNKLVSFQSGRSPILYDVLSVNIGITPTHIESIYSQNIIAMKPISHFVQKWDSALEKMRHSDSLSIAIIGGGPAGIETASALSENIKMMNRSHRLSLFHQGKNLLIDMPAKAQRIVEKNLTNQKIKVELNSKIVRIENDCLIFNEEKSEKFDLIFLATHAQAPIVFKNSGLKTNAQGFLSVSSKLQSEEFPEIFAAGDCIDFSSHPLPKAGVFAVRQGMILSNNVRQFARFKRDARLLDYIPQKNFLKLIHIDGKKILASRGSFASAKAIYWPWKKWIDQRFMNRFGDLPFTMPEMVRKHEEVNTCGGCGAKVSNALLSEVIALLKLDYSNELPKTVEDCYPVNDQSPHQLVSVDGLRAFLQDPFFFGSISALHALSDLWASGAKPHSLVVSVGLAHRDTALQRNFLIQVMSGILNVCKKHQIILANAHTFENAEDHLSITVIGKQTQKLIRKTGNKAGNVLLMSKQLGTGIGLHSVMKAAIGFSDISLLLSSLLTENKLEDSQLACIDSGTDITGFGLIGHLIELIKGQRISLEVDTGKVKLLPFAERLLAEGNRSFLIDKNKKAFQTYCHGQFSEVFYDPQTNGPLVVSIQEKDIEKFDQKKWAVIGKFTDDPSEKITFN